MSTTQSLPSLVRKQFNAAQECGALTFFPTRVTILQCEGVPFQLRFSPALANKPKTPKASKTKPANPFENPSKDLFITNIGLEHHIILNKFPVNPEHFILATKEFKLQTDMLEESDFGAAWKCIQAYKEAGEELFGFFNSGEHSGASQPHRHMQFLPVESMRSGIDDRTSWNLLLDQVETDETGWDDATKPELPFQYFAKTLPKDPSAQLLAEFYRILLGRALGTLLIHAPHVQPDRTPGMDPETHSSYNLGLTARMMVLCPRITEGIKIKGKGDSMIGPIGLNGTILGGTLLVKSEEEWDTLRNDESKLLDILQAIGIPHDHERVCSL